jgi:hypothetical protein
MAGTFSIAGGGDTMQAKQIAITIRLSKQLHDSLIDEAYTRKKKHEPDASMQRIITRLLEEYFEEKKRPSIGKQR